MALNLTINDKIKAAARYNDMAVGQTCYLVQDEAAPHGYRAVNLYSEETEGAYLTITKNHSGPALGYLLNSSVLKSSLPATDQNTVEVQGSAIGGAAAINFSQTHLQADAVAWLSTGQAGPVNFTIGFGLTTGAGIKDDSLTFKAAGCGFQFGRRVGLSFFGNELTFDFTRLYQKQQAT